MWVAELYGLKALSHIVGSNNDFSVKKGIRVRYDKIKSMNLDDLLKKQKEVLVLDKEYYSFSDEQTKKLKKILTYLSQGVFAAYTVQNWLKLQNMVKLALNFICYTSMTPFNHAGTNVWVELAAIALCCADMLVRIRKNGFHEFKRRYERKMIHT